MAIETSNQHHIGQFQVWTGADGAPRLHMPMHIQLKAVKIKKILSKLDVQGGVLRGAAAPTEPGTGVKLAAAASAELRGLLLRWRVSGRGLLLRGRVSGRGVSGLRGRWVSGLWRVAARRLRGRRVGSLRRVAARRLRGRRVGSLRRVCLLLLLRRLLMGGPNGDRCKPPDHAPEHGAQVPPAAAAAAAAAAVVMVAAAVVMVPAAASAAAMVMVAAAAAAAAAAASGVAFAVAMAAGRLEVHVQDAAGAEGPLAALPFARDTLDVIVGLATALAVRAVALPVDIALLDGPEGAEPAFAIAELAQLWHHEGVV